MRGAASINWACRGGACPSRSAQRMGGRVKTRPYSRSAGSRHLIRGRLLYIGQFVTARRTILGSRSSEFQRLSTTGAAAEDSSLYQSRENNNSTGKTGPEYVPYCRYENQSDPYTQTNVKYKLTLMIVHADPPSNCSLLVCLFPCYHTKMQNTRTGTAVHPAVPVNVPAAAKQLAVCRGSAYSAEII